MSILMPQQTLMEKAGRRNTVRLATHFYKAIKIPVYMRCGLLRARNRSRRRQHETPPMISVHPSLFMEALPEMKFQLTNEIRPYIPPLYPAKLQIQAISQTMYITSCQLPTHWIP